MSDPEKTIKELSNRRKRAPEIKKKTASNKSGSGSIEEKSRWYEFIVNTSRDFLTLIDTQYHYVAVNDAYCKAHNKKSEEVINRSVAAIWGDDVFGRVIKGYLDRCFSGEEVHYEAQVLFSALGLRTMAVACYPYHNSEGTITHAVVVSHDITKKKAAEKELLALKKAVETMQLGVTITDTEGNIIYTNPAEAAMHGRSVEELLNHEVKLLAPQDLWHSKLPFDLRKVKSWRRESLNLRKDGSVFPVQLMSDVVRSNEGDPLCIVTTCEDITERKKSEDLIRQQVQRLTTLREIDLVILASLDLRVVLGTLLSQLRERLNIDAAAIMTINRHSLLLEPSECQGFRFAGIKQDCCRLGEGLSGRIALEHRPIRINNFKEHKEEWPAFFEMEDFVSYYGLPLIAKGAVKGTLEIFHRSPLDPGPEWLEFLEALARQAAIAIDNATMFEDLQRSNIDLALAYDTTLEGWSHALDLRDRETEGHSRRVTELTLRIAKAMGMSDTELVHIRRGALLHDIGKMGVPDSILLKPGPLTDEEWEIMKRHSEYAYEMLLPISFLKHASDIPYCHHEKWDGTGYPRGLKGTNIPIAARIFSVADIWDALSSDRPYRPAYPKDEALSYMRSYEGTFFDPEVLKVFFSLL